MDKEETVRNSTCEEQISMAEHELSAFIRAVTELRRASRHQGNSEREARRLQLGVLWLTHAFVRRVVAFTALMLANGIWLRSRSQHKSNDWRNGE